MSGSVFLETGLGVKKKKKNSLYHFKEKKKTLESFSSACQKC